MDLTLDHTFDPSDFLIWYHTASPSDACPVSIPAMQDWQLTITKTAEDRHILLHPYGHRSQSLPLEELLDMLQSIHQAMVARTTQPTAEECDPVLDAGHVPQDGVG